jgi:hypothetical protein
MHEFPSKGDVLVRPTRPSEDTDMNACFMQGTWDLYARGYQEAATRLYEWVAEHGSGQDTLVYPFVFNWRMCVELRLKELIWLGRFLTDRPRVTKWNHPLDLLWAEARSLLDEIESHESFDAVGNVITQLCTLDRDSQRTRYPFHKKTGESFPPGTPNLSLAAFQSVMLKLAAFFEAATGYLGQMADGKHDEIAADQWER